jgi:hypothetical protein
MSITAIARQAQGIRAGEVIAKLAEDAYFMRVDNRVNQPPPTRNRDNEATSRSANPGPNRTQAELPAQPNRTRSNAGGPPQGGNSNCEVVPHRAHDGGGRDPDSGGRTTGAPTTEPTGGPTAVATAAVETTRTATPPVPHRAATTPARRLRSCGGKRLDKHSIDKWDQLKEQFTSNFAGAMGRSGTRMDLAMVKQEQGETLHKYMRRFFDKRATVVNVTNKEVIDLFQDGLYHRRTFEDFGRRRPRSIPHLKDMITSWADEEDKANAKYDAIRGKTKQNQGGGSGNNVNQGGRNNNYYYYSSPNRKRKPDNTTAAIQRPAKENPKRNSGSFKDLLLTDKRRIPLRSASVRTPHLFHHGIPKVLVNPRSKGITSA